MGAISGTLSYKVFYAQGEIPEDWQERFVHAVEQHAFGPLEPDDDEDESIGWVVVDRPLQSQIDLHAMLFDHFINLSLRQDRYAVPSGLLNAHFEEAVREYMLENKKRKLSKFEKDDIKEMVKRRLKEKQYPRMRITDMSWDMRSGRVRFWSHSNKTCELFQGFFEDTFGLQILPANPYMNAVEAGLAEEDIEALKMVEPSNFVGVELS